MVDRFDALALALGGTPDHADAPAVSGLTLDALGRFVGASLWVERRLFEVLGSWVASEAVREAQIMFDVHSQQHAWHAELFAARLPALDSVDPAALTVAPNAEVDRLLSALAGGAPRAGSDAAGADGATGAGAPSVAAGGTLQRLVGVGRVVLPRMVVGYALALRRLSTVSEAPLRRCLRLVLRDQSEQWQATEALVEALLRRPHDVAVVTSHQQQLEQLVAGAGAGLVPWPGRADHG